MDIFDRRTFRILNTTLLFTCVLAFLYAARETLIVFVFSIFFAYLLDPLVTWLEKPMKRRSLAIVAACAVMLALVTLFFALAGPKIARSGQDLVTNLPQLSAKLGSGEFVETVGQKRGWSYERRLQLQRFLADHRAVLLSYGSRLAGRAAQFAADLWWIVLIPILALFFLRDGRDFKNATVKLVDRGKKRELLGRILANLNIMLGAFIRAQLTLAGLAAAFYTALLSILNVPYAIALGPAAGICEFIPVAGPVMGGAAILLVAFITSAHHLLLLVLCLLAWRAIQDYFNAPRIMGNRLEIHPLAAIFGVLAGGEIAGIAGVFLSIPVMAGIRIVWHTLRSQPYVAASEKPPCNEQRLAG